MESKICTAPRTAYWKPFKVKEVVVVEYRALVVEDGKNPQLKYKKRKGIAMCAKEKDDSCCDMRGMLSFLILFLLG